MVEYLPQILAFLPGDLLARLVPTTVVETGWALFALWLFMVWTFPSMVQAKRMYKEGRLIGFWRRWLIPLAILFLIADFLFNVTFGSAMFKELPKWRDKEFMFTSRVQRHVDYSSGRDLATAMIWAQRLNAVDPGHIRMKLRV